MIGHILSCTIEDFTCILIKFSAYMAVQKASEKKKITPVLPFDVPINT
jgi:hypothetical protein